MNRTQLYYALAEALKPYNSELSSGYRSFFCTEPSNVLPLEPIPFSEHNPVDWDILKHGFFECKHLLTTFEAKMFADAILLLDKPKQPAEVATNQLALPF